MKNIHLQEVHVLEVCVCECVCVSECVRNGGGSQEEHKLTGCVCSVCVSNRGGSQEEHTLTRGACAGGVCVCVCVCEHWRRLSRRTHLQEVHVLDECAVCVYVTGVSIWTEGSNCIPPMCHFRLE